MTSNSFAADYKEDPYWWDRVPRPDLGTPKLPANADVVIVGSGYTGLCAALETARAGRHTVVIDAEDAGWGCSSRNGGQIGGGIKDTFEELVAKVGRDQATAIFLEDARAQSWIREFTTDEKIDCDYVQCGRFHAAHSPKQYEKMAKFFANQPKGLERSAELISRSEQHKEIDTEAYFGGIVFNEHASVDPARYHQGLLERALEAGVTIVPHCAVTNIVGEGSDFQVSTARGAITAREVIVATNGYTGQITPWQRRRVIPIGSYMIATEPIDPQVMARLMPKGRVVSDSRKVVYYYRTSPDRTRILFGGRVSHNETNPTVSGPKLHADLVQIFPELAQTKISHSWVGFVAYTFDTLPHIGKRDGIHYAMGYCGVGVAMAGYFGTRVAQKLLGNPEGKTAFDNLDFQTRPLYTGTPWFLAPSVRFYRWRDRYMS
jgi:glycine/D-amino acid oxidase-like deaminating enzyme